MPIIIIAIIIAPNDKPRRTWSMEKTHTRKEKKKKKWKRNNKIPT